MNDNQKEVIRKIVYIFAKKANITDNIMIENEIKNLISMQVNDAIDAILIHIDGLLNHAKVNKEDVFSNTNLLLSLNPEKYKSATDLIKRLEWIKGMNLEHPKMPLSENHQLVIDAFDAFNVLIQNKFDCYYTGGLMGYLATNHELERYHGDLDLFINEQQLEYLKQVIDLSKDFEFVSNMDHKEVNGHEYKIVYKDTVMSIGLFLFERKPDNSITTKGYYYENQNSQGQLFVDEHHFSKEYTSLCFSEQVRYHNNIPYKMMSLESIYNSKKNGRPKDKYDASIIKNSINQEIDYKIDVEKQNNYNVTNKPLNECIIHCIEKLITKKLEIEDESKKY